MSFFFFFSTSIIFEDNKTYTLLKLLNVFYPSIRYSTFQSVSFEITGASALVLDSTSMMQVYEKREKKRIANGEIKRIICARVLSILM